MLASCCACRKAGRHDKNLTGTQWQLIELGGKAVVAGEGYKITLDEAENRYSGVGDCNRITGSFSLSLDNQLKFGMGATTRMFCPNQSQEDRFLEMLQQVDHYKIDRDLLLLLRNTDILAIMQAR